MNMCVGGLHYHFSPWPSRVRQTRQSERRIAESVLDALWRRHPPHAVLCTNERTSRATRTRALVKMMSVAERERNTYTTIL